MLNIVYTGKIKRKALLRNAGFIKPFHDNSRRREIKQFLLRIWLTGLQFSTGPKLPMYIKYTDLFFGFLKKKVLFDFKLQSFQLGEKPQVKNVTIVKGI